MCIRDRVSVDSASEAEGATLTVKVAVKPEVKIGAYNGLTVEKKMCIRDRSQPAVRGQGLLEWYEALISAALVLVPVSYTHLASMILKNNSISDRDIILKLEEASCAVLGMMAVSCSAADMLVLFSLLTFLPCSCSRLARSCSCLLYTSRCV